MLYNPAVEVRHQAVFLDQGEEGAGRHHVFFFLVQADQHFIMATLCGKCRERRNGLAIEAEFIVLDGGQNMINGIIRPCHPLGQGLDIHVLCAGIGC
nr:hypothetical protein [Georgfuchsia toluolica]